MLKKLKVTISYQIYIMEKTHRLFLLYYSLRKLQIIYNTCTSIWKMVKPVFFYWVPSFVVICSRNERRPETEYTVNII